MVKIKLVKLSETAKVPSFADEGSNGCDLYANIDKDIRLRSHRRILVKTGISIDCPVSLLKSVKGLFVDLLSS